MPALTRTQITALVQRAGFTFLDAPGRISSLTPITIGCENLHAFDVAASVITTGSLRCPRCARYRYRISDMQEIARERGGECLSVVYRGNLGKLLWRCARGHEWHATPNTILSGCWCPACNLGKYSIDEVRAAAARLGATLLSESFRNINDHVLVRCANGHEYRTQAKRVLEGRACARCAGLRLTIDDIRERAAEIGGRFLSPAYTRLSAVYRWRCARGHEFEKRADLVMQGHFCGVCSNHRSRGLDDLREAAAARGGELVSTRYAGTGAKYTWRCAAGHQWRANAMHVMRGASWCPECSPSRQHTLAEMRALARERGGRCLSRRYVKSRAKLEWQCAAGHRFEASPDDVFRFAAWCTTCDPMANANRGRKRYYAELRAARASR